MQCSLAAPNYYYYICHKQVDLYNLDILSEHLSE